MAMRKTKTAMKDEAQDAIMNGIANVLGYVDLDELGIAPHQQEEFRAILRREADRVARLLGYDEAWVN